MASIGGYIVQHRYHIAKGDQERLIAVLRQVRDHAEELGLSGFEAWIEDEDESLVSELHGYDSWSHWRRLADREPPPWMRKVYDQLGDLIVGGLDAVETKSWHTMSLPE